MKVANWIKDSTRFLPFPEKIKEKIMKQAKETPTNGIVIVFQLRPAGIPINPNRIFCIKRKNYMYGLQSDNPVSKHLYKVYYKIKPLPTERFILNFLRGVTICDWTYYIEREYPELLSSDNPEHKALLLRLRLML